MLLRKATPADAPLLRSWEDQPHVAAAGIADWPWDEMLGEDPDWRRLLIAETEGRPVGFVQIIDPAREVSHYWGDCGEGLRAIDIWIGPADALARGYGTAMMQEALALCFADPEVRAVVIDPRPDNHAARRFYERLGFRFIDHRRLGPADDPSEAAIHQLTRADWRKDT